MSPTCIASRLTCPARSVPRPPTCTKLASRARRTAWWLSRPPMARHSRLTRMAGPTSCGRSPPSGYAGWAGTAQITTASPLVDPAEARVRRLTNGLIHKLSLTDGREAGRRRCFRHPRPDMRSSRQRSMSTAPICSSHPAAARQHLPYQGHVVAIDRLSGRIASVFNTLCANRHSAIVPSNCSASSSAILSRGGAVVEADGKRLLISTGERALERETEWRQCDRADPPRLAPAASLHPHQPGGS